MACCTSQSVFTLLYPGSSFQNASEQFVWCIHLSFTNLSLRPGPEATKKYRRYIYISTQLYLCIHSESDTCVYELLLLQWPIVSHPTILNFHSDSSYIYDCINITTEKHVEGGMRFNVPRILEFTT